MSTDLISLRGVQAFGHHGVLDAERRDGQTFSVDLDLAVDLRDAAATDDLSHTVDYGRLAAAVHDAVATEPVDLLETLADRLAGLVLTDPLVSWVRVTVHKPQAPLSVPVHDVAVTIERSRP
ncbi:MAG: Dihydroneopterin aldolase [uncultured Nocardioidaceae bacterium]|uniref:7,8-dihydroneopterin aldolase n=1 Tax=uncultured Nocardioidaceae bacterium TaxID=253824 RepID=A0A6J4NDN6_9ACTN|nr:MAG: Dihydroneopterin aldolase [uncultured Nocardioidaceae bacterium]